MISALSRQKRILVCVGPGGVGKTTTAAALGALAAREGRRTLVSTIDPAPRLADAFGVPLTGEPVPVSAEASRTLGAEPGLLHVARLDTARAFATLIEEQVDDASMRRRIFENRIYREITTTLTGSQEYAATLALYELVRREEFDLIVLDTPPTAHALDFLEAPKRISEAISSPAIHWFARPSAANAGRLSWQRLRSGGAVIVKRLAKFTGSTFLEDVAAFLTDFQTVLGGFLERARAVEALLRRDEAAFLLVLAPEVPAVDEALFLHQRLRDSGVPLAAFVANRVHPRPGVADVDAIARRLHARSELADFAKADLEAAAERLARTAIEFEQVARGERRELERLAASAPGVAVLEVPLLERDVADLLALRTVGDHLVRPLPPR